MHQVKTQPHHSELPQWHFTLQSYFSDQACSSAKFLPEKPFTLKRSGTDTGF